MVAVFDLLDSGWRPGDSELECARFIENWTLLPAKNDAPFRMIGSSWTLPLSQTLVVDSVFAVDRDAHWARTLNEWVAIGEPATNSAAFDAKDIRRRGLAWLWAELKRLPASA